MRIKDAITTTNLLMDEQIPVMFWGSPGIGKSDVARQIAKDRNMQLCDVRLSQMDPVDMRGVPFVDSYKFDGEEIQATKWAVADFFARLHERPTVVLFDEINSAPQATQASAYQFILDRSIGDFRLPDHTLILAAGNNIGDGAITNMMSTALRNRLAHVDIEVHLDDWATWAIKAGITTEVLGFIRFRPALLNEFDKKEARANKAFATPRGWQRVSRMLAGGKVPSNAEFGVFSAIVGEGSASELKGYLKHHRNLPDIDAILKNPTKVPVPEEPAVLYALATKLGSVADEKNFEKITEYGYRMAPEFQVIMVVDAVRRDSKIAYTDAFTKWTTKNSKVVF